MTYPEYDGKQDAYPTFKARMRETYPKLSKRMEVYSHSELRAFAVRNRLNMALLSTARNLLASGVLFCIGGYVTAFENLHEALHPNRHDAPQVSSDGVWTDIIIDGDWRIQRHAIFGHVRLLDPQERRLAFGDMQQCYGELQRWRECGAVPSMTSHVVICLHGLRGSRTSMQSIKEYLAEQGDSTVINFGYASTQGPVQEQAYALESVLRNLRGVRRVSFVAHSMGNIVVRHLLYKLRVQGREPPLTFERMVMISPPNHGSDIANTVAYRGFLRLLIGPAVDQLAPELDWPLLEQQLDTPPFEFGIVVGIRGTETGYSLRVPGDDDGLLSLSTQELVGSSALWKTKGLHQFMPRYPVVQAATLSFLRSGQFVEAN